MPISSLHPLVEVALAISCCEYPRVICFAGLLVVPNRCPVCSSGLVQPGDTKIEAEDHIKQCLERTAKYLVYDLPAEKGLIGTECRSTRLQSCCILLIQNRYSLS
jgi:hypothetical protein